VIVPGANPAIASGVSEAGRHASLVAASADHEQVVAVAGVDVHVAEHVTQVPGSSPGVGESRVTAPPRSTRTPGRRHLPSTSSVRVGSTTPRTLATSLPGPGPDAEHVHRAVVTDEARHLELGQLGQVDLAGSSPMRRISSRSRSRSRAGRAAGSPRLAGVDLDVVAAGPP
jgi:hypothetical protein